MNTNPLIERIRKEGNPLINGKTVTFIWQGQTAPLLIDDLHNWERAPQELTLLSKNVLAISFELPVDAYFEYAYLDPETQKRIPDPFNPQRNWNGLGNYNHFFYMPEAAPSPLTRRRANLPHGTIGRYKVGTWMLAQDGNRIVHLYKPATDQTVPLLIVYDGLEYLGRGKIVQVVDNLIARKRIQPIAMVLLENDRRRRIVEYACSEATISWLVEVLLPLGRKHLNLLDIGKQPGAYGVLGASMGGLMALYAGLRLPHIFGNVISQSGVFRMEYDEFVTSDLVRCLPGLDVRIWMDVGRLEWLLEDNRAMHALLKKKGYKVSYHEFVGGHNFTSWRNDFWRGLEKLFG